MKPPAQSKTINSFCKKFLEHVLLDLKKRGGVLEETSGIS